MYSGTVAYGYDATNQLTSDGTSTYAYDANGNRTSVVTGGVTATYTPGTNNQLTNDGTWTYTYDAEGNNTGKNRASGDTWSYGYDNANRMTTATEKSDGVHVNFAATYTYDVEGHVVQQDEWTSGTGVVTTRFAVDPLQNGQAWADLDGTNAMLVRYQWGDGADQIEARTVASGANAGVWAYLTDRLGSVRDLEKVATQAVADHLDYSGFGVVSESNAAVSNQYQYTGKRLDPNTGLQHNGQNDAGRWYGPATGRWTSLDPMGFKAGDGNWYRYVENNPISQTDPSGLPFAQDKRTSRKCRGLLHLSG